MPKTIKVTLSATFDYDQFIDPSDGEQDVTNEAFIEYAKGSFIEDVCNMRGYDIEKHIAVEPVNNGREWPNNNTLRDREDRDLLNEVAELMITQFTPHAVNCNDPGCGSSTLNSNDWSRYYQMLDCAAWLKERAMSALLDKRMKEAVR